MDVYVPKELPYGVYWQAVVYDTYRDGSWRVVESDTEPILHYPEDGQLNVPESLSREVITQTVTNYLPNSSLLYAAPEVVNSDKQMLVDATYDAEGRPLITSLHSRFLLRQGDRYQVTSRVSVADAPSLRGASTDYPQWVLDRYLQLPDTVTPQTLALAEELTAGLANPYDKAIAVRNYLRNNIKYNDQIQAAPDGVDPVHYVVFDLKEGYCTYYASAMAVMLRSQGIPARLVSGYALGEYDEPSQSYRVRAANAHTWVEVYFPDYGWIHFEPTSAIPVAERPTSQSDNPLVPINEEERNPLDSELQQPPEGLERADGLSIDELNEEPSGFFARLVWWQAAIGVILLVIAGGALYAGAKYNDRIEGDVDSSFLRLGQWARWLGIPWRATQTPYEQADSLLAVVPEGQEPVRNLSRQYVLRQFSPAKSIEDDFNPHQEWRELRPLLLKKKIIQALTPKRRE
jgi:transglutaminase-like putative cysteine protease